MDFLNNLELTHFAIAAVCIPVILYRPYLGLLVMIFMIPLEELVRFSSGFTAIRLLGILTFASFLFNFLFGKEKIDVNFRLFLPLIFFFLWAMITPEARLTRLARLLQYYVLFLLIISLCSNNPRRLELLIWVYIIGCLAAVILASSAYIASDFNRMRASLEGQNKNNYGAIIGIGVCLFLFAKSLYPKKYNSVYLIIFALLLYGLVTSGSRGSMVAFSASFLVYMLLNRSKLESLRQALLIGSLVAAVLVVGVWKELIYEDTVQRIESIKNYEDTTFTGRKNIWRVAFQIIEDNFITGVGLGNFPEAFGRYTYYKSMSVGSKRDPHSTYISILAETGIIGFLIMLWFSANYCYLLINPSNENRVFALCILVFIATASLVGTFHFKKFFWFSMAIGYLLSNYTRQKSRSGDTPSP